MADLLAVFAGSDILDNLLLALRLLNILVAAYLTYHTGRLALRKAGGSMGRTFKVLALTFVVMLAVFLTRIFSVLPGFRWDVLEAFTELVFMLAIFSVIGRLESSVSAQEFVSKKIAGLRGME